jgi:hypothetical protein
MFQGEKVIAATNMGFPDENLGDCMTTPCTIHHFRATTWFARKVYFGKADLFGVQQALCGMTKPTERRSVNFDFGHE